MAELTAPHATRSQIAAIASLRWQLSVNSLRTLRGRLELVSRIFTFIGFSVLAFGGSVGCAFAAWYLVSHDRIEFLAILFWLIFLFWQLFPLVATAFTETTDSSNLLRFPLSFRAYCLIRSAYSAFSPSVAIGAAWIVAIAIGIIVAKPTLFLYAIVLALLFVLFNLLLGQMIFAWLERWLARRRTRELIGILVFVLIIALQFIGPAMGRFGHAAGKNMTRAAGQAIPIERLLPPGLPPAILARAAHSQYASAAGGLLLFAAYTLVIFWLLRIRLRAEFAGENLSEAAARVSPPVKKSAAREGWSAGGLPGPVAAILEKEFHVLSRSGPVLFTLVMPVVILLIFRFGAAGAMQTTKFPFHALEFAFPIAVAYAFLVLTNLIYNNFGSEGVGVQFYFVSPVPLREVFFAKNLTHTLLALLETALIWVGVAWLFGPPSVIVALATLAALLFVLPANFMAGNFLSIFMPKKTDSAAMGRQRLPTAAVMASMGTHAFLFGICGLTLFLTSRFGLLWLSIVIFLALAAICWFIYAILLGRCATVALDRRETLIAELSRAS
ncbi:MAG: hypothetical protein WBF14_07820 [Candidatus Acidiferrales bacterium]